jgi:hypothetical protein
MRVVDAKNLVKSNYPNAVCRWVNDRGWIVRAFMEESTEAMIQYGHFSLTAGLAWKHEGDEILASRARYQSAMRKIAARQSTASAASSVVAGAGT